MSLDHILIGLYQETEKIHDRVKTSQRIYRMGTKGKVFNVKGMKAVYTTRKDMIEMNQEHLTEENDVKRNPETANC